MKVPICEVCLKSDILCQGCSKKLEDGLITHADIDISKFLFNLSDKVKSLKDVSIKKIIDSKSIIIISEKGDAAKLVGKNGTIVKNISKAFKKPVKIIEESGDIKVFIQDLIAPVKIISLNKVFTTEGRKLKITVPARNKINIQPEMITDIVKSTFNEDIQFFFE